MSDNDLHIPDMPTPDLGAGSGSAEAKCFSFMGAVGGAGATSLAIQTAYSAMKELKAKKDIAPRVCLLDLDFEGGALSSYLDVVPGIQTEHLSGDGSDIDPAMASAFITKHASGLRVLSAPGQLGGNDLISEDSVLALMDAASQMYDVLVMDVPRLWRPWTHAAIAAADRFALVTDLTIPGLHLTRDRARDIDARCELQNGIDIVINKFERRRLRATLTDKDATRGLGRDVAHFICTDTETVRDAMNCGEPSGNLKPESRFVKDVEIMAADFMGHERASETSAKRGLFQRRVA